MSKRVLHKTSWQKVASWYQRTVGERGQYYHEKVILPGVRRLGEFARDMRVLDLGCGQGVLERFLDEDIHYTGVDLSSTLIVYAKNHARHTGNVFKVCDATRPIDLPTSSFDRIVMILSLQNMQNWAGVFDNLTRLLTPSGKIILVLNHPHFRIPRQTGWGEDVSSKQHYRKVYRYLSRLEIPVDMNPSQKTKHLTWSYHRPLSDIFSLAQERGMVVSGMEEWTSDRESQGAKAKMENRARSEIPLFMTIVLIKR